MILPTKDGPSYTSSEEFLLQIRTKEEIKDVLNKLRELAKERDFYLSKLRDIEIICEEAGEYRKHPVIKKILEILHVTIEGFKTPDDTPRAQA